MASSIYMEILLLTCALQLHCRRELKRIVRPDACNLEGISRSRAATQPIKMDERYRGIRPCSSPEVCATQSNRRSKSCCSALKSAIVIALVIFGRLGALYLCKTYCQHYFVFNVFESFDCFEERRKHRC